MDKEKYDYSVIETFGQLMLSLPGDCLGDDELAGDVSSDVLLAELFRVAKDFDDEWRKVGVDDHEDVDEDFLEEVQKLADWVKDHLYDVVHNGLEYGGYRARKKKWGVSKNGDPPEFWFDLKYKAVNAMMHDATDAILKTVSSRVIEHGECAMDFCCSAILRGDVGGANASFGNEKRETELKFNLVSKLEEVK